MPSLKDIFLLLYLDGFALVRYIQLTIIKRAPEEHAQIYDE
jgi:hypothetical protein